ncbi:MAG: UvrD-helicase domain-containing protein [Bacilli bacterium]|nr:UvrD-helicase domain-containing protein [Bacilli bacterium]
MSNPTPQQKEAIEKNGCNIIVSAGAGSGKTFVLKERVLKEVQDGTSINDLIILTFTKKAANEMKERIRKILTENNVEDAKYIDSAYISTFDSFAHSLVNKYSYLLDIDKNFNIIDSSIAKTELRNILDEILEDKYEKQDEKYIKLINNLCYKDDEDLRKDIIEIYSKYTNIVNKDKFLNIDSYYTDEFIENKLDEYENNIFDEFNKLIEVFEVFVEHSSDEKTIENNNKVLSLMQSITSLDELIDNYSSIKVSTIKENTYDDKEYIKGIKDSTYTDIYKSLGTQLNYYRKDLKEYYLSTYDDVIELKNIILELDDRMNKFKKEHNSYEFTDIAFKAIELVRNHKDIRNEIKNKTHEILIDEYQDTNDIQDEFISYIENNNLYMVGDIKQSIYGFRNANPKLFKSKYDSYSHNEGGYKIDLTSNFRSRGEVINNINDMFSLIMFDEIGGANYKATHKMEHGKVDYDKNIDKDVDYNLSILNYNNEDKKYKNDLIEAYIIADDIKNKMNRHAYNDDEFKPIRYKDFCILVDTSTRFETLKKVLESKGIPAYIAKGLSIKNDDEIYILKNLITCLTCIKKNEYKEPFKHAYASIARSYIYKMDDQEIYDAIKLRKFKDTDLYIKLKEISNYIDSLSNKEILYKLIDEFDFINKTISVGNIDERLAKLEHFIKQSNDLNKFGMDIYTMEQYFNDIVSSDDDDIQMEIEQSDKDAVTIMTIHGSKGLEFNYVYMPYLATNFMKDRSGKFVIDNELGLLVPFNNDGIDTTFMYKLYKQKQDIETISERIRLFYVAITRAKENFILITDFNDKLINNESIEPHDLLKCKSFRDFVTIIKPYFLNNIKYININELGIKNNLISKKDDYNSLIKPSKDTIDVNELNIDNKVLDNKHFSKPLTSVMTQELKDILDLGTIMHYCFEVYDFNHDNLNDLSIIDEYKNYIKAFLKHDEVKDISNAKIYKEHEIKFKKDGSTYHGFIDLLVEYDEHFDIIDYKTNNIDSPEYKEQLTGYKEYIESRYNKKTNIYLYSIKKDIFKKL